MAASHKNTLVDSSEAENLTEMFKSVMSEMKELKQTVAGLVEALSDGELSDDPRHEDEQNASGGKNTAVDDCKSFR